MIRVKALGYIYKRGFENKNFWNYYTGFIRHKNRPPKYEGDHIPMGGWVGATHYSGLCMLGGSA